MVLGCLPVCLPIHLPSSPLLSGPWVFWDALSGHTATIIRLSPA